MARPWPAAHKVAEECGELVQELMKLKVFPNGKHPARKRNLILTVEDEMADVIGAINYMIDKERLDRKRIEKRAKAKYRKFSNWWGIPHILKSKSNKGKK